MPEKRAESRADQPFQGDLSDLDSKKTMAKPISEPD